MAERVAKEAVVQGRVQGVWYRASTQQQARQLGVVGWVRNEPDGSVRLHAQGEAPAVQALLDWCEQGPPHAQVERVEATEVVPGDFTDFSILR